VAVKSSHKGSKDTKSNTKSTLYLRETSCLGVFLPAVQDFGGEYLAGTIVRITADPAPESYLFDKWIGAVEYVNDTAEVETTVEMPAEAITITAVYAAEPEELVSFSQEVWPLFQKSCTNSGCHSFSTPSEPLNSYQAIKEILPSVRSVIVSGAMPVEPYELTEAEKELIITWIDQGGLNN
jgi:hypothetical protein